MEQKLCALLTEGPRAQSQNRPRNPCKIFPSFSPKTNRDSLAKTVSFPTQIIIVMQDYMLGVFIYWLRWQHECGGLWVALYERTSMEVIQIKQFIGKNFSQSPKYYIY